MTNLKLNEWQQLSQKKDIECILDEVKRQGRFNTFMIFGIALAIATFIAGFGEIFSDSRRLRNWLVGTSLVLIILVPLVLYCVRFFWARCKKRYFSKDCISKFDNYICFYTATASAYAKHLNTAKDLTSADRTFCYIEGNYYIDKSIESLRNIKALKKVFAIDPSSSATIQVEFARLVNIVEILANTRNDLKKFKPNPEFKDIEDSNKYYDGEMEAFIIEFIGKFGDEKCKRLRYINPRDDDDNKKDPKPS